MRLACNSSLVVGLAFTLLFAQATWTARGTEPPALHYRFVEAQKWAYDVELSLAVAGARHSSRGSDVVSVISSRNDRVSLHFANLSFSSPETYVDHRQPGVARIFIPQFSPPVVRSATNQPPPPVPMPAPMPRTTAADFSQSGELISGDAKSRLPLLLGYGDQLMIEPLPPQATAAWTRSADVALIVDERGTTCPAREETRYAIVASKASLVYLTKSYSLRSAPDAKGISLVTMCGSGNLEFDNQEGLFRSLAMTYVIEDAIAEIQQHRSGNSQSSRR